jgi:CRP/FNR family cyclic AMP-dependent transcriptional regulator
LKGWGGENNIHAMIVDVMEELAFFEGLSTADIKLLMPYFNSQLYPASTIVFEQGDIAEFLYLVVKGEVLIRYKPDDGPMMIVTRVQPGGVFGWSAALGNVDYTSGAMCTTDCEVLQVRGKDLRSICEKHPGVGKVILDCLANVISERWQSRRTQVTSMLARGVRQPVSSPKGFKEVGRMAETKPLSQEMQMKGLIEQLSAYIEHFHGGSVEFVAFNGKVLKVRLGGACLGCPLSPATLHGWVEGTVRQFFPDIEQVEAV